MPRNTITSKIRPLASLSSRPLPNTLVNCTTDDQTLFEFMILIVDIKYRIKYGCKFDEQHGKGYSDGTT